MTTTAESLRQSLNRADPNALADMLRTLMIGDTLRALPVYLRNQVPATNSQNLSTVQCITLPEDAKAAYILRATVKASTSVALGELTVETYGTTPSTGQVAVTPNGDIGFVGTDGVTLVDVIYVPQKGDVIGQNTNSNLGVTSLTLNVPTSGQASLPAPYAGNTILLMQANVLTAGSGGVTGQKIILVPTTSVTATTKAALSSDSKSIWFNHATDLPLTASVDILVNSGQGASGLQGNGVDINALLEGLSSDT
jgi:hypothetical protein